MIATDPLSLLFTACFLIGLVYFIVTALLGNLGHGFAHGTAHHVDIGHHGGCIHTSGTHTTHAVSHGTAHTSWHAATSPATQSHQPSLLSFLHRTSIIIFLLRF